MINIHKKNNVTSFEVIVGSSKRGEKSVFLFLVDGMLIGSGPQIMSRKSKLC